MYCGKNLATVFFSEERIIFMRKPCVDYTKLRPGNIGTEQFRHVLLLLFWPAFGLLFGFLERGSTVEKYYPVHCALDDIIPFCEWFFIPYMFWFVFLIGTLAYTFFYDVEVFRKMMYFIIFTYGVTIVIYMFFPTCQELRPGEFLRDNFLTRAVADFYEFDTNTNVCPSIHVLGSFAAMFALWDCKKLQKPAWKIAAFVAAVAISVSTVFVKQHSVIDVAAALPLCLIGYYFVFVKHRKRTAELQTAAAE